jgi:26S proteasome regulatory subunit N1
MLNTGIRTEGDFALSLLGEYTENKSVPLKTSAFMGLALAYAGSHREDLLAYLLPHVADDTITMEISGLAALALGFIFVGSMVKCRKLFCKPSWKSMSEAINHWMRCGQSLWL